MSAFPLLTNATPGPLTSSAALRNKPQVLLAALLVLTALLLSPAASRAAVQECRARVLQPVTDDMSALWKAGAVVPVDIARDGANGGQFCSHGGACLPRQANGKVALQLTNCKVGPAIGNGDYRLVPDATLAGAAAADAMTRRNDAEQRLSKLGFSNAAAGSLADEYVNHPHSAMGRRVARALAGSSKALKTLQARFP